jgi:hypothetical protein
MKKISPANMRGAMIPCEIIAAAARNARRFPCGR